MLSWSSQHELFKIGEVTFSRMLACMICTRHKNTNVCCPSSTVVVLGERVAPTASGKCPPALVVACVECIDENFEHLKFLVNPLPPRWRDRLVDAAGRLRQGQPCELCLGLPLDPVDVIDLGHLRAQSANQIGSFAVLPFDEQQRRWAAADETTRAAFVAQLQRSAHALGRSFDMAELNQFGGFDAESAVYGEQLRALALSLDKAEQLAVVGGDQPTVWHGAVLAHSFACSRTRAVTLFGPAHHAAFTKVSVSELFARRDAARKHLFGRLSQSIHRAFALQVAVSGRRCQTPGRCSLCAISCRMRPDVAALVAAAARGGGDAASQRATLAAQVTGSQVCQSCVVLSWEARANVWTEDEMLAAPQSDAAVERAKLRQAAEKEGAEEAFDRGSARAWVFASEQAKVAAVATAHPRTLGWLQLMQAVALSHRTQTQLDVDVGGDVEAETPAGDLDADVDVDEPPQRASESGVNRKKRDGDDATNGDRDGGAKHRCL